MFSLRVKRKKALTNGAQMSFLSQNFPMKKGQVFRKEKTLAETLPLKKGRVFTKEKRLAENRPTKERDPATASDRVETSLAETDDLRVVDLETVGLVPESDTTKSHDLILLPVIGAVIKIGIESRRAIAESIHLTVGKTWIAGETIVMGRLGIGTGDVIGMLRQWMDGRRETIAMLRTLKASEMIGMVHLVTGEAIAAGDPNGCRPKVVTGEVRLEMVVMAIAAPLQLVRLKMVVVVIGVILIWDGVHLEMFVMAIGQHLLWDGLHREMVVVAIVFVMLLLRDGGVRLEMVVVAIVMLLRLDGGVHLEMAAVAIGMFLVMAVAVIGMHLLRDGGVHLEMAVVAIGKLLIWDSRVPLEMVVMEIGMLRLEMAVVVIGILLRQDGVQVEMGEYVVVVVAAVAAAAGRHDEKTHAVRHKVSTALKMGHHQTIEIEVGLGSPIIEIEVAIGPGSPIAGVVMWIGIDKDARQLLLLEEATA
jgi:hypothetical protein